MAIDHLSFDFPSRRLSISSECENQNANEDDRPKFQVTVPLDSPLEENPSCNLDFDTELLYDSDCGGDKSAEQPSDYEEEMVLDSEDEDINGSRLVVVTNKTLPDNEAKKKAEQSCAGSGSKNDLREQPACDGELVSLDDKSTQNLEEWSQSQADALGFVDHFVLINKFDMSQGTDYKKTSREKSPAAPSAKGPRNLARRIDQQTQIKEKSMFEFIDNDPHEGLNSFRKKRSFRRNQTHKDAGDSVNRSLGDEGGEKKGISSLDRETKDSSGLESLDKIFAGHSLKDRSEISREHEAKTKVNSSKELELTGKKLEASDMGSDTLDIYDFGFNTQIAAEAIEALAYGYHFGYGPNGACQDMENNTDGSFRGFTKDIGDVLGSAKRKKRSDRKIGGGVTSLSKKQSGIEEFDSELTKSRLVKRSKLFAETGLYANNSANSNESSRRSSLKPIEQCEEGILEKNSNMISPTPIQNIPLVNERSKGQCVNVSPFSCRTRQQDSGNWLNQSDDGSSNPGEKLKDNVEHGILVNRRKQSPINANPLKVTCVGRKSSKLCSSNEGARKIISNTFPKSDMWNSPKGKRTSRGVGKRNQDSTIGKASMKEKAKSTSSSRNEFPGRLSGKSFSKPDLEVPISECKRAVTRIVPTGSQCIISMAIGAEQDHISMASTLEPSGSECTTTSFKTGKNVVTSNNTYNHYHKTPCKKNVPRKSLLKELIKLGVPEKIPEFATKELRRRRDMAHCRILFSQHLDDDVVKQQKKVAARLGTSIASCSMDATHFIADKFARTKNMLEAIALGKPVVTHQWLESCGQANCFIDERNYILRDAKKEKEFGFCMPVSLARSNQHPLLKGRTVFVTPNIKPEKEMIINLVKAVHGQPVEKLQISALKDEKIPAGLLILSCKEDHSICLPFLEKGTAVYSSELLLNGIITQKLEYKRHQLFINDVKRNCS